MVDNMNDKDIMNIVDKVFEEMEVNDIIKEMGGESSDEDHVLSADSDCISNCSEDLTEISEKIVTNSQINALKRRYETVHYIFLLFHGWCVGCVRVMHD